MPGTLAIAGTVAPRWPYGTGLDIGAETGASRALWARYAKGADWQGGFSGRGRGRKAMRKGLIGPSGKLGGQAGSVDTPMPACRFVGGSLPAGRGRTPEAKPDELRRAPLQRKKAPAFGKYNKTTGRCSVPAPPAILQTSAAVARCHNICVSLGQRILWWTGEVQYHIYPAGFPYLP